MAKRFSQYFSDTEGGVNFTLARKVPATTNTTYYNPSDTYETAGLAENRAYNIGCTGSRPIIYNSQGQVKYAPCVAATTYVSLMQGMPKANNERRYYSFDPTQNLYDIRDSAQDNLYGGFDYKNRIFEKTMSKVILRDPVKASILAYLQKVIFGLVESTKQIKNFFNYTVKKNNRRVF
jgi:hypothetical protein